MEQKTKSQSKKVIIAGVILLGVVAIVAALYYFVLKPKGTAGDKIIILEVVVSEEIKSSHTIQTDAEFLRGALEGEGLIEGSESGYGMFVQTVDGVTASEENQEWWCFTKNGEEIMSGVDDTPIANGDKYEATLMIGW